MLPRPDWSRPLPRPLTIPDLLTLETLADVRTLVEKHLPQRHRDRPSWRHVTAELEKAAAGADALDVAVALRLALALEGVPVRVGK